MESIAKSSVIRQLALACVSCALLLSTGCVTQASLNKAMEEVAAEDRVRNKETSMAMGQREFDVSKPVAMKALITAFANKNMAVVNLDREIGYMLAEGSNILPAEKHEELGKRNVDRLNKKSGTKVWRYVGTNSTKRITVNVTELSPNRTRVKLGVSNRVEGNIQSKSHELPYFMTTAIYEELWREIDKAIFIEGETGS